MLLGNTYAGAGCDPDALMAVQAGVPRAAMLWYAHFGRHYIGSLGHFFADVLAQRATPQEDLLPLRQVMNDFNARQLRRGHSRAERLASCT